ncbi:MAG TPA: hypothetical protein VD929_04380 [Caulobacteraceae bacterium]|nr:hypothetical protein [Caulobacteraceae bacterium]
MTDEKKPDAVSAAKIAVLGTVNSILILGALAAIAYGVCGYDYKVCRGCEGIGKFIVSCTACDGDGKVSLWDAYLQGESRPRQIPIPNPPAPPPQEPKVTITKKCFLHEKAPDQMKFPPPELCPDCKRASQR